MSFQKYGLVARLHKAKLNESRLRLSLSTALWQRNHCVLSSLKADRKVCLFKSKHYGMTSQRPSIVDLKLRLVKTLSLGHDFTRTPDPILLG